MFLIEAKISLLSNVPEHGMFSKLRPIHGDLADALAEHYTRKLDGHDEVVGKMHTIVGKDKKSEVWIHYHESGPEVFLIPLATFLGTSIAAGVIGNLAYDAIKELYLKSVEVVRRAKKTYDKEPFDLSKLTEQELIDRITITITTPEGSLSVKFYEEKGLSPLLVKRLVRQIRSYQEKSNLV